MKSKRDVSFNRDPSLFCRKPVQFCRMGQKKWKLWYTIKNRKRQKRKTGRKGACLKETEMKHTGGYENADRGM